jgi:hypothetical protein
MYKRQPSITKRMKPGKKIALMDQPQGYLRAAMQAKSNEVNHLA